MTRLTNVLLVLVLLSAFHPMNVWAEETIYDTDSILALLDKTIANASDYVDAKKDSLRRLRKELGRATDGGQRYAVAMKLYRAYRYFDNDSALHYLYECRSIADKMGDEERLAETLMNIGHQHVIAGYFHEAERYLRQVRTQQLSQENLPTYYHYWAHLYRELEQYTADEDMRHTYNYISKIYNDSLEMVSHRHDAVYWQRRCIALCAYGKYEQAESAIVSWKPLVKEGTTGHAYLAACQAEIFANREQTDGQKYWLAVSAIDEIKNCNMNLAALWKLAEIINEEGDTKRAMSYIDFSWENISRFSAHKRARVMAPIMSTIHNGYQTGITRVNRMLIILSVLAGLMAVFLLIALLYASRARRVAVAARASLQRSNAQLEKTNQALFDSNRVKDEYIRDFLQMCSTYIEKMDAYRLRINRKLKANQLKDLLKMTSSEQLKKDERDELMAHFDTVFLSLFPSFVHDFNELLQPEARITLEAPERLNTVLRIFALVRLGINESSKIAEFLDYSSNSIYNYRSRIKNQALVSRNDFEERVRQIGVKG